METQVKLAEEQASACRSDNKALREAAESQLMALGRFEQKLEDGNATAKRSLDNDVDQLRQHQEHMAEKLEAQLLDLQETFCSRPWLRPCATIWRNKTGPCRVPWTASG